jgi:phage/plasmid-associated DNA primase
MGVEAHRLLDQANPFVSDLSDALRRRMHVLPATRNFKHSEIKAGLFDDIIAEELPGILNRYIEGYQALAKRGQFDEPAECVERRRRWLIGSNNVPSFIETFFDHDPDGRAPRPLLWKLYGAWADVEGISAQFRARKSNFFDAVSAYIGRDIGANPVKVNGVICFPGLGAKPPLEEFLASPNGESFARDSHNNYHSASSIGALIEACEGEDAREE